MKKNVSSGEIASMCATNQPQVDVLVVRSGNTNKYLVKADTGAQVGFQDISPCGTWG